MLRMESKAVSEDNDPVHQEEEFGFGQPALADEYPKIRSLSKQQDIRLDKITRLLEQLSACLEHEARQPRLAMEADGPADTETRERTEGAAIAVQAMRGDSGTTEQKVKDGPRTSISFGVMAEPPALPCRDDVVVESGNAAPKSCLPSLEMRSSTVAGGSVPTGKTSTATETTSNEPLLRFYATEEMNPEENSKKENVWTFHPPGMTAASGNCLLLPTAGGSLRQNAGEIGLLIQAVCKVTSAPDHLWDRGARWFVMRLYVLEQPGDELRRFSE